MYNMDGNHPVAYNHSYNYDVGTEVHGGTTFFYSANEHPSAYQHMQTSFYQPGYQNSTTEQASYSNNYHHPPYSSGVKPKTTSRNFTSRSHNGWTGRGGNSRGRGTRGGRNFSYKDHASSDNNVEDNYNNSEAGVSDKLAANSNLNQNTGGNAEPLVDSGEKIPSGSDEYSENGNIDVNCVPYPTTEKHDKGNSKKPHDRSQIRNNNKTRFGENSKKEQNRRRRALQNEEENVDYSEMPQYNSSRNNRGGPRRGRGNPASSRNGNRYEDFSDNYYQNGYAYRSNTRKEYDKSVKSNRGRGRRDIFNFNAEEASNGGMEASTSCKKPSNRSMPKSDKQGARNKLREDSQQLPITRDQKEHLTELLTKGTYECMVCYDRVKPSHAIWSCSTCYHCFHIGCIKKWMSSSKVEGEVTSWRCPACNNESSSVSLSYYCFCGKRKNPENNQHDTPHSCGELCGKKRGNEWCTHNCTILCHPGPCPPCNAFVKRSCGCGATSKDIKCSVSEALCCGKVCSKVLSCGVHTCKKTCHEGDCGSCEEILDIQCCCGKEKKTLPCNAKNSLILDFLCKGTCDKLLSCSVHSCKSKCHEGPCQDCQLTPERVTTCSCGKKPLSALGDIKERTSCLDPVPVCEGTCGKTLNCGKPGSYHLCMHPCHTSDCPPCPLTTPVK